MPVVVLNPPFISLSFSPNGEKRLNLLLIEFFSDVVKIHINQWQNMCVCAHACVFTEQQSEETKIRKKTEEH